MSGLIKRSGWFVAALLGCLMLALSAQAASFDCAKAGTKVEHLICDNPEISKLDDELSLAYKAALQDQSKADAIKQGQKQWMKERNGCIDAACVKLVYEARLASLSISNGSAEPGKAGMIGNQQASYVIDGEGRNQPFCETILATLNKRRITDDYRPCLSEEILKLPGVKDPAWEKLDLSQHEELAKKIYTLNSVGSAEYFRKEKVMPQMYPSPEQQQRSVEGLKRLGAEMFMLRLSPELLGNERVLVTLRYKNEMCGRSNQLEPVQYRGEAQDSAWVNTDLKGIATGPGAYESRAARPLMYNGRLYLVRPYGGDGDLEVFILRPHNRFMDKVCNIGITIR